MLCAEIFTSLKVHNLQSIFVLFRTFLVAFVLEQRTYSKTQQQKKLSSFQTTILEVEKILKETNHFKYGDFQYKID
jgi:positive regulator of sigma E activity